MRSAAKAMIKLLGRADGKARGFFIMERAAGRIIGAGFFKRHTSIHHIDNINAVQEFLNKAFWDQNYLLLPKITT
jgi:hypothetical protein